MKYILLALTLLIITGCEQCFDIPVYDREKTERVFNDCLDKAANARSGKSYSTNDDEDYDEVIAECKYAAFSISIIKYEKVCK